MGWLIALGVLTLIAILPIGVSALYNEDGPRVSVIAGPFRLLVFPQKKKEKADRQLRASLQAGDKIVTIGGFTGRILTVKDDEVTFETGAAKTRLTVKKWAIQTREGPEVEAPVEETEAEEESK